MPPRERNVASWGTSFLGWARASLGFASGNRIAALFALHPPLRAPVRQAPVHLPGRRRRVKRLRVEAATDPVVELLVPLVAGVAHRLQKLLVAPGAAHVFRRAGPCPLDADRIPLPPLGPEAALEQDLVPPAIPEVVLVLEAEPPAALGQDVAQLRGGGVLVLHLLEVLLH